MNSEKSREHKWRTCRNFNERVIPRVFLKEDAGCFNYLSERYPKGDIVLLRSEYALKCGHETDVEPISIELVEWKRTNIIVVQAGEKRRKIQLSKWFVESMRNNYYENNGKREINTFKFVKTIPGRFQNYYFWKNKVRKEDNEKSHILNMKLLKDDMRLNESLIYLYSKMLYKKADSNYFNVQCAFALKKWLSETGRFLSGGFHYDKNVNTDMDLIPIIAAICLMDGIKINGNRQLKRLCVHIARMLGYACGLSIHEEQIINGWLMRRQNGEQWNRLRHLSLGGETLVTMESGKKPSQDMNFNGLLSPYQHNAIIENADSILRLNSLDMELKNTVYALLLSVADIRDYSEFFKQMDQTSYCTVKLAPVGRLLAPAFGRYSAFLELPDAVRALLNSVFKQDTGCSVELCTDTYIPLNEEVCRYWDTEVENCIKLLNDFINSGKRKENK